MNYEDEYIQIQLNRFSDFRKEFMNDTKHDDILMVILKVHLYIEKEMMELTNIYFKHPKKLNDYSFKKRLDLLYALGVIEKELFDPIKTINEIRNQLSHRLDFEYTEDSYKKIYNSLSNDILKEFKLDLEVNRMLTKNLDYVDKTKILLACIWTSIKAEVLTSFISKRELAKAYEVQAINELIEYKKSKNIL